MIPFYGKAHVAYIPNGYITGLSKIARVVDAYAAGFRFRNDLPFKSAIAFRTHSTRWRGCGG
jgi:GTP cyclohydrolase I